MKFWSGKHVVVAVGGGIAAYKTLDLLRLFREAGAHVEVVATESALRFVTSLTLQALSGNMVLSNLFQPGDAGGMDHIRLARDADLVVIAPTTADLLSRMAAGAADDLLTTLLLARQGPVLVAPAMNSIMWQHPATQRNVSQLKSDGIHFIGPEYGSLACGAIGEGRLADVGHIFEVSRRVLSPTPLLGRRILITAGPTQEELDPVRYLSNHSSGKMGWGLCNAAMRAGAEVMLIHGPVALTVPKGVSSVAVQSARQMYEATLEAWNRAEEEKRAFDVAILVAAVADFRPTYRQSAKIKKESRDSVPELVLEANPDILAAICQSAERMRVSEQHTPFVVGFAAETSHDLSAAQEKLKRKGCDLLIVNNILAEGCGFGCDTNHVTLLQREGEVLVWPLLNKIEVGERLMALLASLLKDT